MTSAKVLVTLLSGVLTRMKFSHSPHENLTLSSSLSVMAAKVLGQVWTARGEWQQALFHPRLVAVERTVISVPVRVGLVAAIRFWAEIL